MFNDYNKHLRINNFVGMTDISGCFDRIIPSLISMLNIKNGCTPEAVKMHADTLINAKYYLKTKNGISEKSYSHTRETPVYGNGQGAGDSPSQWSQESAMLIDLYEREAPRATMTTSTKTFTKLGISYSMQLVTLWSWASAHAIFLYGISKKTDMLSPYHRRRCKSV
jgi:hypothetical protein